MKASKTVLLPSEAEKLAAHYFNLSIGMQKLSTPYFINEKYNDNYKKINPVPENIDRFHKKSDKRRALIGKGKPGEIEKVTIELARKYQFDLNKASVEEIREFMQKHGLGIDCSGFVVWVLNEFTKQKHGKEIWNYIKSPPSNPLRKMLFKLRPVENTSVKVLISNSTLVKDIADIRVGDLLIAWNGQHVLLITKVEYVQDNPISFEYINSTWWYGKENGVRKGNVKIKNLRGELQDQMWEDLHKGEDWTLNGIKKKGEIRRLKF